MGATELNAWIRSCWEMTLCYVPWTDIKAFGNSNFFTALAGSLAGAFAGAYIAQRIANRNKDRDELLKEIRNTNAAITLSVGICNSAVNMKQQNIKSLKEDFMTARAELLEIRQKYQPGVIQGDSELHKFNFKFDLRALPMPQLPTETLQKQIFEKLSVGNRPLSAVVSLIESTTLLREAIEKRNQLIEQYTAESAFKDPLFYLRYFGLSYSEDPVDLVYPNLVDAIYSYADDAIFFSHLLCDDLSESGRELSAEFKKNFGKGAPPVNKANFEKPLTAGLLPGNEAYADWLNGFVKKK